MDLNLILKICLLIVVIGIAFNILKLITSFVFKLALIILVILLVCKFFALF
ncbi:hypothetical protein [Terrisporobacter sp.]|uniref:hypothetical protein n=1 Tax=Terrisporobacter sp. TaxID=1965305 RepID=UPI0026046E7C|nr:hypothetical protein [Terrisporobacter sp.]